MSLFSVFDPISYLSFSLNWTMLVVIFAGYFLMYFLVGGLLVEGLSELWSKVSMLFKDVSFPDFKGLSFMSLVLFMYVGFLNFIGLFPFTFTVTGHLMITLSVGLMMWAMSMIMGWVSTFESSSGHLVPEGCPLLLAPFMVLVESLSQLIRPLTLSVRLAANMMAGHLIIGLISSVSLMSWVSFSVSVFLQTIMLVLEIAVCFIQAFVFSILVMLYALDFY